MNSERIFVDKTISIKGAMKVIDQGGLGIAFVVDYNGRLVGTVTDGDIRRAILNGTSMEKSIREIMNTSPITAKDELKNEKLTQLASDESIRKKMPIGGTLKIPILDEEGRVKDVAFLYEKEERGKKVFSVNSAPPRDEAVKKVLVVGGAGYLGSVICLKLLDKGCMVRVLDNLTYGDSGIKNLYNNPKFKFIKGDMRNIQTVVEATKDVDAVIHLAAIVGDPASALNPEETIEINYLGTKMLVEVCKYSQINRFIFASTCSVYGKSESHQKPLTEESELNPVSLYARTKIESEKALIESSDENFSPTIFRMATLFGYSPRMRFDLVVNILSAKGYFDKEIPIFGGEQYRPIVHVKDAAESFIKCLEAPIENVAGEIFNIGSNRLNYKILDLGEEINEIIHDASLKIETDNGLDERSYYVEFKKMNEVLNYEPRYSIPDGVKELLNEFRKGGFEDYKDIKYSNYKSLIETNNSKK